LKGYQWPFDYDRLGGSSNIDMLIINERRAGRKVYLDYRQDPAGFDPLKLPAEAKDFFERAGISGPAAPCERLVRLNGKAAKIYEDVGFGLASAPLEVNICAQHNNGGAVVDADYRSNVKNLYVIGEAAGVFGIKRPGGSALNSGQVGGLRAARHIAGKAYDAVGESAGERDAEELREICASIETGACVSYDRIREKMSLYCGPVRDRAECEKLLAEVEGVISEYPKKSGTLKQWFKDLDTLTAARALLLSVLETMEKTGSRGGSVFIDRGKAIPENKSYREYKAVTGAGGVRFEKIKPLERRDVMFEELKAE